MFSLLVEIKNGPFAGKKVWIQPGQTLQVGRTDTADLAIESDKLLSRLHFAIDCESGQCRIRDLGSRNGTFLNRSAIQVAPLHDGDRILAGETEFQIEMKSKPGGPAEGAGRKTWSRDRLNKKGESPAAAPPASSSPIVLDEVERLAMLGQEPVPRPGQRGIDELTMSMPLNLAAAVQRPPRVTTSWQQPTVHGLRYLAPPRGLARPLDLARALTHRPDFYMLINLENMEQEARSYFQSPIQGKRFTHVLPGRLVLVSSRDEVDGGELFRRAWGRDALIGLMSSAPRERLVATIRNFENSFLHPSTLRADLAKSPPEGIALIFVGIDGILVESEGVDSWTLIVNESSQLDLAQFGPDV